MFAVLSEMVATDEVQTLWERWAGRLEQKKCHV